MAVAIRRGEQFAEVSEFGDALKEYQKALETNRNSSLAHYRIAEVYFLQNNYQSAANEFREALNGDLEPKWTEVWAHINLGKIFDITGQRDRAVNEYNLAIRTKDNTQGAQEEAAKYLKTPYERKKRPDRPVAPEPLTEPRPSGSGATLRPLAPVQPIEPQPARQTAGAYGRDTMA